MKVIIVGAGLGGLTAAFCLARRGHQVQVFEHRQSLNPQGSGINVRAPATRLLYSWGLSKELDTISDDTPTALLRNLYTGDVAMRNIVTDVSAYPDLGTTRRELMELFHRKAREVGAVIHLGTTVVDIYDDEHQAHVVFEDGMEAKGDLILVADGIRSRLRSKVLPGHTSGSDPIVSNVTLYGVEIPGTLILDNDQSRSLSDNANLNCWLGRDGFVISRFYHKFNTWRGSFVIRSDAVQHESMWDEHGDIGYVRSFFSEACPQLVAALGMAQSCDRWKLAEMPDLPTWISQNGRMALLGDSAHGMQPNAAQGYSQIVEDIGVLDHLLLQSSAAPIDVPQVLRDWQNIRKPRAERIKAYAKWNTEMFLGAPLAPKEGNDQKNVKSLKRVIPDKNASFHSSAFIKWALDHDVIAETQKYLSGGTSKL